MPPDAPTLREDALRIAPTPSFSVPRRAAGRAENLALSADGTLLAYVDPDSNRVRVHERRAPGGTWSDEPTFVLEGEDADLAYPHDVDFTPDGLWLVVASRRGRAVTGYRRERARPESPARFASRPAWKLRGRTSALGYTDGAKVVPPDGRFLAAASLAEHRVTFFRRGAIRRSRWRRRPAFVLEGRDLGLAHPDGLAFSPDGTLLAVANHGDGTAALYARAGDGVEFGPRPLAVLGGAMRCPHSVAFSRDGLHLAVTEAGGRAIRVFARDPGDPRTALWSRDPVLDVPACPVGVEPSGEEGGPKGVAFGPDVFAWCSPEAGVRVHSLA
jgi:6-phosphogluconolactonase (cycloisomerase 2 family)